MRNFSYAFASILFLLVGGCAHSTIDGALPDTDAAAQHDLDARFVDGMNRKDVERVMASFWNSPDLILVIPDGTVVHGWENAKQAVGQFLGAHESVNLVIDEVSYVRVGDGVMAVGTATFRMRPKNGPAYEFTERWTDLRRNIGGRWVYVLDHAHALSPPKTSQN